MYNLQYEIIEKILFMVKIMVRRRFDIWQDEVKI
nr:MAG TPA: hypothetical protein [Caudoviricetes sp.]